MDKRTMELETFQISDELKNYIIPLNDQERNVLAESIRSEGCREPLMVWKSDDRDILVDGHNRYAICKQLKIDFQVKYMSFANIDEVKGWMLNNQLGRRNLSLDQLSYYRGLKYLMNKKEKGGYNNVEAKGKKEIGTAAKLSGEFGVSESTIKRDAKFAQAVEVISNSNPRLKLKILKGDSKLSKADIQILSTISDEEAAKLIIKNEADLVNKAKIIKNKNLEEIESTLKGIEERKIQKAQDTLRERDPLFLDKAERLNRIKARIISAINVAINDKDVKSIELLKNLIDKLSVELLD